MELKDLITYIGFAIAIVTVFVKNENRITKIETEMKNKLDTLIKSVEDLKETKQDKEIVSFQLNELKSNFLDLKSDIKEIKTLLLKK
jgi:hypothetical protein